MRAGILAVMLALCIGNTSFASDVTDARPHLALPDKTRPFVDRSYGFSIDLPVHFELVTDEAGLLVFQSSEKPGLVIVRPTPGMGLANVQQLMRNGFESQVTRLKTKGSPMSVGVEGGKGMTMAVDGSWGEREVAGYLAGIFGPGGQGYMVLIGAVANKWPILESEALSILESFALQTVQPGYEYERWAYRLRGKHLVFVAGYGRAFDGALFSSDIILCSNGEFHSAQGTTGYSSDPLWGSSYSYSGSEKSGTWSVRSDGVPMLRVDFKRGGNKMAPIETDQGYIFLDGRPYEFRPNTFCP